MEEHNAKVEERQHLDGLQIDEHDGKMVVTHTVDPNDTLFSISLMYNVGQKEIMFANGLMNEFIGMLPTLRIPMTANFKFTPPACGMKKTEDSAIKEEKDRRDMAVGMLNSYMRERTGQRLTDFKAEALVYCEENEFDYRKAKAAYD